jgi:hypothetical protein
MGPLASGAGSRRTPWFVALPHMRLGTYPLRLRWGAHTIDRTAPAAPGTAGESDRAINAELGRDM